MVGVASLLEGRNATLLDISPYATHISQGLTTYIEPKRFLAAAKEVFRKSFKKTRSLLLTTSRQSKSQVVFSYLIWSERLLCNKCNHEFVLWNAALQPNGRIAPTFKCPSCKKSLDKKTLTRKGSVPVEIVYREPNAGRQTRSLPTDEDMRLSLNPRPVEPAKKPWNPDNPMMNIEAGQRWGEQWRKGYHYNITHVQDFFSPRNWIVLSYLWQAIEENTDPQLRALLRLAFTGTLVNTSRMVRYTPSRGGRSNTPGTLYFPMVWLEQNPLMVFKRRVQRIKAHLKLLEKAQSNKATVLLGTASKLENVDNESIDFVLTDPPFGENIQYAELNFIAEAWLQSFTDTSLEAVVNQYRGQNNGHYLGLMQKSFAEIFRVLKSGRYAAVFFNNTDTRLWMRLREIIKQTGFRVVRAVPACKGHQGWNQVRYRDTVTAWDPIIFLWKPANGSQLDENITNKEHTLINSQEIARGFMRGLVALELTEKTTEMPTQQLYSHYVSAWFEGRLPGGILDIKSFASEARILLESMKKPIIPKQYDSISESSKSFVEAIKLVLGIRERSVSALRLSGMYEKWNEQIRGGRLPKRRRGESSKRRTSGVFYTTPSVIALTVSKTMDSWFNPRVQELKSSFLAGREDEGVHLIEEIVKVAVLDPAVGTGLFLLGVRQYLREIVPAALNGIVGDAARLDDLVRKSGILAADANSVGSTWDRWIVQNCLWGVDIDVGALHVAKVVTSDGLPNNLSPNLLLANGLSLEITPSQTLSGKFGKTINWTEWSKSNGKGTVFWDIVVGNPPWGTELPDNESVDYSLCYNESALGFLLLSERLLRKEGKIGFVLPSSWIQASTWRAWRRRNLRRLRLEDFWILPESTFPDATFTAVPIVAVFSPGSEAASFSCESANFPSLSSEEEAKTGKLVADWKISVDRITTQNLFNLTYLRWSQIPGYRIPLAGNWWIERFFGSDFSNKRDFCINLTPIRNMTKKVVRGLKTGSNREFIHKYNPSIHGTPKLYGKNIGRQSYRAKPFWIWLAKGGDAVRHGRPVHFIQPFSHVVRWDTEAVEIYRKRSGLRNIEYYGRLGIGFPSTGRHSPLFRRVEGMIFDADYPLLIVQSEKDILYLLAVLNSPCVLFAAKHLLNHSVHFKTGDLLDLSVPNEKGKIRELLTTASERIMKAINEGNFEEEMKYFIEVHEAICELLEIPSKEKAECESWYSSRFPGMKTAFENPSRLNTEQFQIKMWEKLDA
jgi:hypothetical protein